ncbi:hypothetical protein KSF_087000 [Reticulibacter mediterranei]|uniref:ATP-binding protein n=1 Tax=Reticulibacter mediterranei TaxID=2778369 RepID=A0A8J3IXL2_9CHLR|nr:ATP-binding protein [Reticulibacter mediterranei]GHO98652.1 hypothetical protein KSF_087000 [Reticulibacter mediterranei]
MENTRPDVLDWKLLRVSPLAKRLLEIAASGHHSAVLIGPSQTGKVTLARSMTTILPDLPLIAPDSIASLRSVYEHHRSSLLVLERLDRWDEVSLAWVRQQMAQCSHPGLLIATLCPCPCGKVDNDCQCSPEAKQAHQQRLRPTLERFALAVTLSHRKAAPNEPSDEPSALVRQRVEAAQCVQFQRNHARLNSRVSLEELDHCIPLDLPGQKLMEAAHKHLALSSEQTLLLRQVAATIADLAGDAVPSPWLKLPHLAEAISYHPHWT